MFIYDIVFFLVFTEIKKIQAAVMKFVVLCERLGSFRQQVKWTLLTKSKGQKLNVVNAREKQN
jgi:hypothetical protein